MHGASLKTAIFAPACIQASPKAYAPGVFSSRTRHRLFRSLAHSLHSIPWQCFHVAPFSRKIFQLASSFLQSSRPHRTCPFKYDPGTVVSKPCKNACVSAVRAMVRNSVNTYMERTSTPQHCVTTPPSLTKIHVPVLTSHSICAAHMSQLFLSRAPPAATTHPCICRPRQILSAQLLAPTTTPDLGSQEAATPQASAESTTMGVGCGAQCLPVECKV